MKASYLLLCQLVILLFGCNYYHTPDSDGVTIPMNFKGKGANPPFLTSLMVDTIRYVPIENGFQIGEVSDVRYCNDVYYLLDQTNKAIVAVDESGHIVFTIQKQGRALGEYISLEAFDVNPNSGEISIYDSTGDKVLVYSSEGVYERQFIVDPHVELYRDFSVLPDGSYICFTPDYNDGLRRGIWMVDSTGVFVRQLEEPVPDFIMEPIQVMNYCCKFSDGSVGVMGGEDKDNIYHISTSGDIHTAYHFDVDAKMPLRRVKQQELSNLALLDGEVYGKLAYFETSQWLIVMAYRGRKMMFVYYDKQNGIDYPVHSGSDLIDDADIGDILCSCGDYLFSVLYPDAIIGTELESSFPGITSSSNPVIKCMKLN